MTMWSETTEGMHNLFRLSSRSSLEGFFYKPRADRDLLHQYAKGLIATTGCPSGEIQTRLRLGQYDEARRSAAEFQEIFGKDSFFLELMDHGIDIEKRVRDDLLRLGKELGIPPVATNDSHYNNPEDADAHDALICVASGKRLSDTNRLKFDGGGYYIKSAAEMRALWADRFGMPEACDNTLLIAERCEVDFTESTGGYMARADVPAGETEESWFVKEVWRGIESRYPGERLTPDVKARVDMELGIISQKGYCGYYLVVADFINWAKDNGIRVGPGRGSGAGSIAAYALRITDLCPLEHGLFFERFLNPERPSMPDFDIDFDDHRRGEVIQYVTEKYGADRVAQIATFGRLKSKAAIKDAARVLDYGFAVSDRITKALPPDVMGKGVTLRDIFNEDHKRYGDGAEFRALHEQDVDVRTIYQTALGLEGQIRNWGVHAAGVIMSSEPIVDVVPIMARPQDGAVITQFDYPMCEALGLVKMDFLGLSNLHTLEDALVNIKANRGEDVVLEELPFDDRATYELMGRGDTLGVFQLDGGGMRALLRVDAARPVRRHHRRVGALPPGPDGRGLAQQVRPPQERPRAERADPPRARRRARVGAGGDLRPDRLPGAGDGDRAGARRLLPRRRRQHAARDGQEGRREARQGVRRLRGRHARARLPPGRDQDALGDPRPVRRLRVQQVALRRLRRHHLLDRLPQGQLPDRVHGRAPHLGEERQGQDGDLPQRVSPDEDRRPASRRQRVRPRLHRGRHRHPLRHDRGPQRRRQRGGADRGRARRARAATSSSTTSSTRCPRWSATSGSSSR